MKEKLAHLGGASICCITGLMTTFEDMQISAVGYIKISDINMIRQILGRSQMRTNAPFPPLSPRILHWSHSIGDSWPHSGMVFLVKLGRRLPFLWTNAAVLLEHLRLESGCLVYSCSAPPGQSDTSVKVSRLQNEPSLEEEIPVLLFEVGQAFLSTYSLYLLAGSGGTSL